VYEHLQFLSVVKDEWLPENGFLTPTLKLKRKELVARFAETVEDMYRRSKTCKSEEL